MSKGKILVVSYHWPPHLSAQSLIVAKLVKYLRRSGYLADVVTAEYLASYEKGIDPGLHDLGLGIAEEIRTAPARMGSTISKLSSAFLRMPFPQWCTGAARQGRNLIDRNDYDFMISFGLPFECHLAALQIKRTNPNLFWIAHFADPWSHNPYVRMLYPFQQEMLSAIEGTVYRKADMLVFVSDELREFEIERFHQFKHKAYVVPHCFDPELFTDREPSAERASASVLFTYVGGFSKRRSPEPLFEALKKLKTDDPKCLEVLRLVFVGPGMEQYREPFNKVSNGVLTTTGTVPYRESLDFMVRSDYLLLIDAPYEHSCFFPSKLVDYIGSGTPILGITPSNSCSARILRECGYQTVDPRDPDAIAKQLSLLVANKGEVSSCKERSRYEAGHVVAEFIFTVRETKRKGGNK